MDAEAKASAEREGNEGSAAKEGGDGNGGAGADATEFQQAKDYGGKETASVEAWEVDSAFVDGRTAKSDRDSSATAELAPVTFDAYIIAEGGWSDSTRRLGFSKSVEIFKPVFGLVANLWCVPPAPLASHGLALCPRTTPFFVRPSLRSYNPEDLKERNMRSQIHFVLGADWPLRNCPIHAEFIECAASAAASDHARTCNPIRGVLRYLKGETHFFALVVSKKNTHADRTEGYLERLTPEERAAIPDELIAQMRRESQQKGLLEMGVLRQSFASGQACLATDNVDTERLHAMVRDITQEMGLPATTELFETNPVQLFDFSR